VGEGAQAIHRFVWSELCDWALEMEKLRLYEGSAKEREDAASVLAWVLERTLRMLHPVMPFVTEEIWQRFDAGDSIVVAPWPEQHPEHRTEAGEVRVLQDVVTKVRQFRGDHRIPPRRGLDLRIRSATPTGLEEFAPELNRLTGADSLVFSPEEDVEGCVCFVIDPGIEVLIPLEGLIDLETSRSRLDRKLEGVLRDAERARAKVGNPQFSAKAPEDVQAKERTKLEALGREVASLREQLQQIGGP